MAEISSICLPDGTTYDLKDEKARIVWGTVTDYDDFKPTGNTTVTIYGKSENNSASHVPVTGSSCSYMAEVTGTASEFTQKLTLYDSTIESNKNRVFLRSFKNNIFSDWKELLGSYMNTTVASNGTKVFYLALYSMALFWVGGYRPEGIGFCFVVRTANNAFVAKWIGEAPANVSISMATDGSGKFTITNSDASSVVVRMERYNGTLTF